MNKKVQKVQNGHMAYFMFDLLGIKEVTKPYQEKRGTQVFELPFKTMYANGYKEVNRFAVYKSGYVRKMIVKDNGASYSCYQLNKTRKKEYFIKDYEWVDLKNGDYTQKWTGKYRKYIGKERIMIPDYEARIVYLCNYILKNYYRNQQGASFYRINDYQVSEIERQSTHSEPQDLPFREDDVKVIINGHRYNLS